MRMTLITVIDMNVSLCLISIFISFHFLSHMLWTGVFKAGAVRGRVSAYCLRQTSTNAAIRAYVHIRGAHKYLWLKTTSASPGGGVLC